MNVKFEKKPAFQALGKSIRTKNIEGQNNQEIPAFWEKIGKPGEMDDLWSLLDSPEQAMLGICIDQVEDQDPNVFEYAIAIAYEGDAHLNYQTFSIPAAEWAIFTTKGPMPHAIQNLWQEIFTQWLPAHPEVQLDSKPQIELYPNGDPDSEDYTTQVWIPIIRK